jgi:hypothetical protein
MSTINTNGIDVNYPVPGQNNTSQGFRDNFSAIKTNLNTASSEISDLQSKSILKQALANSTLNNDMANTLISNASTLGFRSTTYNLGNDLSGTVTIDLSLGDVQYGTIAANSNVTLTFGNWAPTGTQSNVQLQFNFNDSNSYVQFPSQVVKTNNNYGVTMLENYANIANVAQVSAPYGVTQLDYRLSTLDCGANIYIEPMNRPQKSTQLTNRTITTSNVSATGTITASTSSASITGSGTQFLTQLAEGVVLLNSSNTVIGTVLSISSNTALTLTANANVIVSNAAFKYRSAGIIGDVAGTYCYDNNYMYVCTSSFDLTRNYAVWKRIALTSF